mmetsp:Transcript_8450/g.14172  ORF Transcript_8450/g.14172 Transcript_8450/m.14172 type:complete len:285 (-) Transcript_8450:456-1310(-)
MHGNPNIHLISTTDFFYPLVEDPYIQGRVACANVISDVYAMGIDRIDNILMVLAISLKMNNEEREIVTKNLIKGFNDCASEAGTMVTGGQSVMNPWPIIGGVANVTCFDHEYQKVNRSQPGDVIVLTKPLGTQPAVNLNEWILQNDEQKLEKALQHVTVEGAKEAYYMAVESMAHLNKNAATLMKRHGCHGATDVTGFGLLGHAINLVEVQEAPVDFLIHSLPVIDKMHLINDHVMDFKLTKGYSAETSGGLFVMVPKDKLEAFRNDLLLEFGQHSWIIGEVIA